MNPEVSLANLARNADTEPRPVVVTGIPYLEGAIMGTTPRTRRGEGFANEGAAAQEGSLPVYVCNTCQHEVVWATSRRTGRKYLVNVTRGYHDQRFYIKRNAHDCAKELAYQAEIAEAFQDRSSVGE